MSDAKSPSELSMDEIVATIRRIIAEDEEKGAPAIDRGGESGAAVAAVADGSDRSGAAENGAEDILELTQAINEDGSVRHLAPIGPSLRATLREAAPPAAAPVEAEPQPSRATAQPLPEPTAAA